MAFRELVEGCWALMFPELVEGASCPQIDRPENAKTDELPQAGQMPYVYILRCADDSLYVGSTRNLDNRLEQHARGRVDGFTSKRRPVTLVWFQECERIDEASALEKKVKGWRRAKRLALIEGRYDALLGLSTSGSHHREDAAPANDSAD